MCEYCIGYLSEGEEDYEYIDNHTIELVGNFVNIDLDTYISADADREPALVFLTSYWFRNEGPYRETIKRVPIRYCPFCGAELEEAKKVYERT